MHNTHTYCGLVAIVGRSNVGKSTLLNQLLGQKISITADKPQTTRHRILGIETSGAYQTLYVDTPGLHTATPRLLNRLMNRTASRSVRDVDLVIFVVEGTHWGCDDELVLTQLQPVRCPILLAINKIDQLRCKQLLLPHLALLRQKRDFLDMVPICAQQGQQVDTIAAIVRHHLPISPHYFPENCVTDRSQRFMVAEIIREKLIRFLGDELPYAVTVEIEQFTTDQQKNHVIHALIWVERIGQKKMVIGAHGQKIKVIGQSARLDIEQLLATRVHLELWVKVKSGWANDQRALLSFGYSDS